MEFRSDPFLLFNIEINYDFRRRLSDRPDCPGETDQTVIIGMRQNDGLMMCFSTSEQLKDKIAFEVLTPAGHAHTPSLCGKPLPGYFPSALHGCKALSVCLFFLSFIFPDH